MSLTEADLAELGVTQEAIDPIRRAADMATAARMLEDLKLAAKGRYRELALELHPDRTGGDAEKATRMQRVNAAWAFVEKLRVAPPPPRPAMVVTVFGSFGTNSATTWTRSNTSNGAW